MPQGIFITGTDTGVGKTQVSAALLRALVAGGCRAVGMKPVASGCEFSPGGWSNEDARALIEASHPQPAYADCNPYALHDAVAPHLAAAAQGVEIELGPIRAGYAALAASADFIVVEGAGGWAVPLSPRLMQADIPRALGLDVVLVVGLRLGCINHALLSAAAIRADGCRLRGWIGNAIDPAQPLQRENIATLRERLDADCLGLLGYNPPDPAAALAAAAAGLRAQS
ncbi:dethiobiotin synthase [Tahibacter harae]|uniref:ATP-dependent dethiobiotin synthetase BioD n=1 Tax=Tahibacter harae TaxID=2963937 RepID=A0ABT1QPY2_9GAMM|nr:dethiobiotin synthase [Tahibacter harae]MCQ4164337.1 dethiobiotin synthase [Tahibacter harae]